jgi:hypothetical protein
LRRRGFNILLILLGLGVLTMIVVNLMGRHPDLSTFPTPESLPKPRQMVPLARAASGASLPPVSDATGSATGHLKEPSPQITAVRPPSFVPQFPDATIVVEFSVPMDRASVEKAFLLEPGLRGRLEWPAPNKMVFQPSHPLPLREEFTVSLGEGMRDLRGRGVKPYRWSFRVVDGYSYQKNIGRLLQQSCGGCHQQDGIASHRPLSTYAEVRALVTPGNARKSPLYATLEDARFHKDLPPGVSARRAILKDWIETFRAAQ